MWCAFLLHVHRMMCFPLTSITPQVSDLWLFGEQVREAAYYPQGIFWSTN